MRLELDSHRPSITSTPSPTPPEHSPPGGFCGAFRVASPVDDLAGDGTRRHQNDSVDADEEDEDVAGSTGRVNEGDWCDEMFTKYATQ